MSTSVMTRNNVTVLGNEAGPVVMFARGFGCEVMGEGNSPALGQELTDSFCHTDRDIAAQFAAVTFLSDTRALLGSVTTPTLVVQCTDDMLAPIEVGRYVHDRIAGSTLVQLDASGHCPHVSAPEETAAAILHHLRVVH